MNTKNSALPVFSAIKAAEILVIDEDRVCCALIADYLGQCGYAVTTVFTGWEGAKHALDKSWQAIILEVSLPKVDGFEVLR